MKSKNNSNKSFRIFVYTTLIIITVSLLIIPSALSHGGKKHEENEFTAFSALKMATQLYGQLLSKGKLAEDWEIGLVNISISTRKGQVGEEFIVLFEKSNGDPNKVFIFFDAAGKYLGSNFTGI
jgi:hypothetical protein